MRRKNFRNKILHLKTFSRFIFLCHMSSVTGVSSFFCEGPDSKHLRLRGPYGLFHNCAQEKGHACSSKTLLPATGGRPGLVCRLPCTDPCPRPAHWWSRLYSVESPLLVEDKHQYLFGFLDAARGCGDNYFLNTTGLYSELVGSLLCFRWFKKLKHNLLLGL